MGLDYTDGCVNFRDAGGYINLISGKTLLKEGKLFRGGSIDFVKDHKEIKNVKSIINLRNGADDELFHADYYHFPMSNKIEKYDTSQREVQVWLNRIVNLFENEAVKFPIFFHCLSGKDRTGIIITAILLILGIEKSLIVQEYLLSQGDVKEEWINQSIDGIGNVEDYFNRIDLEMIRLNLSQELLFT